MTKDMTKGNPIKLILGFCMPMLFGSLFQQLYNMVDSIIVSKYVGNNAFAGVGSVGPVCFLIIGTALGTCSGFAIPIAQQFGAEKYSQMRKTIYNANFLSAVIAAVLTITTVIFCRPLLRFMNTTPDTFEYAYSYLRILFIGIPVTILYNMLASTLRALGDSKTPLKYLLIASCLNVVFDMLFIVKFHLGVSGAALATILSQLISGILCLIYVMKMPILGYNKGEKVLDKTIMKNVLSIGLPMAFQFSITAIGTMILQAAVNSLGTEYVGAMSAGGKIQNLIAQPMETIGVTMATFGGQNLGAGKNERIHKGVRQAFFALICYTVVISAVIFCFGDTFASLFLNKKESNFNLMTEHAGYFLRLSSIFYPTLAVVYFFRNILQGLGFSAVTMLAGLTELICRSIVAFAFVSSFGYNAVCLASPFAWAAAGALLIGLYFFEMRKVDAVAKGNCRYKCRC